MSATNSKHHIRQLPNTAGRAWEGLGGLGCIKAVLVSSRDALDPLRNCRWRTRVAAGDGWSCSQITALHAARPSPSMLATSSPTADHHTVISAHTARQECRRTRNLEGLRLSRAGRLRLPLGSAPRSAARSSHPLASCSWPTPP